MLRSYLEELRKTALLSPEEESRLWELASRGDSKAHRHLMTAYQPLVFKIASGFRLGETETMELIQEGMVGLLEAAENYDHKRNVAFSLFASYRVRGSMIDYLRRSRRDNLVYLDSECFDGCTLGDILPSDAESPAEVAERRALRERVGKAFKRLPQKEQQVIKGIILEDRSAQSVAEAINVSLGHVYRLQKRGVRRIRGMLSRFMHELKET